MHRWLFSFFRSMGRWFGFARSFQYTPLLQLLFWSLGLASVSLLGLLYIGPRTFLSLLHRLSLPLHTVLSLHTRFSSLPSHSGLFRAPASLYDTQVESSRFHSPFRSFPCLLPLGFVHMCCVPFCFAPLLFLFSRSSLLGTGSRSMNPFLSFASTTRANQSTYTHTQPQDTSRSPPPLHSLLHSPPPHPSRHSQSHASSPHPPFPCQAGTKGDSSAPHL